MVAVAGYILQVAKAEVTVIVAALQLKVVKPEGVYLEHYGFRLESAIMVLVGAYVFLLEKEEARILVETSISMPVGVSQ